jgi:hypothetical protein
MYTVSPAGLSVPKVSVGAVKLAEFSLLPPGPPGGSKKRGWGKPDTVYLIGGKHGEGCKNALRTDSYLREMKPLSTRQDVRGEQITLHRLQTYYFPSFEVLSIGIC